MQSRGCAGRGRTGDGWSSPGKKWAVVGSEVAGWRADQGAAVGSYRTHMLPLPARPSWKRMKKRPWRSSQLQARAHVSALLEVGMAALAQAAVRRHPRLQQLQPPCQWHCPPRRPPPITRLRLPPLLSLPLPASALPHLHPPTRCTVLLELKGMLQTMLPSVLPSALPCVLRSTARRSEPQKTHRFPPGRRRRHASRRSCPQQLAQPS